MDEGDSEKPRRRLGRTFRTAERVTNPVQNLVGRWRPITDAAKDKLHEIGTEGRATILKAPSKRRVTTVKENVGRFTVRVELPEKEPYDVNVWQSFWDREWELMRPGTTVRCRVDPDDPERVLLLPETPESLAELAARPKVKGPTLNLRGLFKKHVLDSSAVIESGKRATATVLSSEPMGMTAPGTEDPAYMLQLEVRADDEPEIWEVEFGQRVPLGAEEMVAEGKQLDVAYTGINDADRVAVDWPATSGGRFS